MCDHLKLDVRTRVRAHIDLDVRGACVRPKKRSQPMPWQTDYLSNICMCLSTNLFINILQTKKMPMVQSSFPVQVVLKFESLEACKGKKANFGCLGQP